MREPGNKVRLPYVIVRDEEAIDDNDDGAARGGGAGTGRCGLH
jgi:hypothetical protein